MEPGDVPGVYEIEKRTFSEAWSPESFLDALSREDTLYLVAEETSEILGYCGLWQSLEEGEIPGVAVGEGHRRKGVATALLQELFRLGAQRGITAYTLEVRTGNLGAQRLYEKLGFCSVGIRPGFYRKPTEDAVIMWKR
jgi:ribosomal-protein-alanine N-acetyltransferase